MQRGIGAGFLMDATWTVGGTVSHFGHRHFRQNRYQARVAVVPVDGVWKIQSVELLDIGEILEKLHLQLQEPKRWLTSASDAMQRFAARVAVKSPELDALLETRQREYLPGFGRMGFMLMLKSLIDPSYFRIEEQR